MIDIVASTSFRICALVMKLLSALAIAVLFLSLLAMVAPTWRGLNPSGSLRVDTEVMRVPCPGGSPSNHYF